MTFVVPTVTAENAHIYREEIERVSSFADRIHIDLADGVFAPTKLVNPIQAWWPEEKIADIHIMYSKPSEHIETLISLRPNLVVFHVESDDNILALMSQLQEVGVKAGIALLESSQPEDSKELIENADHVLIFGGKLGYHGGEAQLDLLQKVPRIKEINPDTEIAWDGGINDENVLQIAQAGVDVMNVGGFIQKADAPQDAYDILVEKLKQ